VNDVVAMQRALEQLGYIVVSLHDDTIESRLRPTRDNVEAELLAMCTLLKPDDTLLVHLACHGRVLEGEAILIMSDIRAASMDTRALRVGWVEQTMRASAASKLVLILDACHAGVEVGRGGGDDGFVQNVYESAVGFALLAGSSLRQVAHESHAEKHGVFTFFVLEAISGAADEEHKGFVTVDDMKRYVLDGVRRWSLENGGLQEPTTRTEGLGDIIVADFRAAHGIRVRRADRPRRVWGVVSLSGLLLAVACLATYFVCNRSSDSGVSASELDNYIKIHCLHTRDLPSAPSTSIVSLAPSLIIERVEVIVKECPSLTLSLLDGMEQRVPANSRMWRTRGRALYELGNTAEALVALQRAAFFAPGDPAIVHDIARCKKILGLPGYDDDLRTACTLGDSSACELLE
jgi:hypothetical protein